MDATELRLNNYFDIVNRTNEVHLPRGGAYKVIELAPFSVSYCKVEESPATIEQWKKVDVRDICGISLTEEWLVKLGFEKKTKIYDDDTQERVHYQYSKLKVTLWNYRDNVPATTAYWSLANSVDIQVPYVHSLQNVFHAIAGTELTLNKQHA